MPHYLNLFVALLCIVKLEILTCFVMKHFSKISSKVDAKFSFPVSKDIMACSTSSEPESNNANFRSGLEKVISTVGSVTTLSVLAFVAPATAEEVVKKVKKPKVLETDMGIKYIELKKGTGNYPNSGDFVAIEYNAFLNNGTMFDTTIGKGKKALSFRFGKKQIIPGIESVLGYMQAGGEVTCTIPAEFAYGSKGVCIANEGCIVPPNEPLKSPDLKFLEVSKLPTKSPTIMRQLKHHEQKLLKKVDFFSWKDDQNVREAMILRKYLIQNREDYIKYSKIVGHVTKLAAMLLKMPIEDQIRRQLSEQILQKLFNMGIIDKTSSLSSVEKLTVSAFCRRRLPVIMLRLKMAESLKEATTFIEQGHVRVGPNAITDPAFLVTRTFEDYVTWVDSSKIKRTIMKYNDKLDDFDLLELTTLLSRTI